MSASERDNQRPPLIPATHAGTLSTPEAIRYRDERAAAERQRQREEEAQRAREAAAAEDLRRRREAVRAWGRKQAETKTAVVLTRDEWAAIDEQLDDTPRRPQ